MNNRKTSSPLLASSASAACILLVLTAGLTVTVWLAGSEEDEIHYETMATDWTVDWVPPPSEPVEPRFSFTGRTVLPPATSVKLPHGGKLEVVHPALIHGGFVSQGEVLGQLNRITAEITVLEAQVALSRAQESLQQAQARTARTLDVQEARPLARGIPQQAIAEAEIARAEANLQRAAQIVEEHTIRAPFSGWATPSAIHAGDHLPAGVSLTTVKPIGFDGLMVEVAASQRYRHFLHKWARNNHAISAQDLVSDTFADMTPAETAPFAAPPFGQGHLRFRFVGSPPWPVQDGTPVTVTVMGTPTTELRAIPAEWLTTGPSLWVLNDKNLLEKHSVRILWYQGNDAVIERAHIPDELRIVPAFQRAFAVGDEVATGQSEMAPLNGSGDGDQNGSSAGPSLLMGE